MVNKKCLGVVVSLALMVVSLSLASAALAVEPTGDFAIFKQCPRFTGGVNFCLVSKIKSGEVAIGKTSVPITNQITLQGGYDRNEEKEPVTETFVGAINGETLSKTAQTVPGGLLDLVNCKEISNFIERIACELVFENGLTGVSAVTELAKPASEIGISTDNLLNAEGVALTLPVKVKLENPFLGSECYIGSSSAPVTLNLTTGETNPPEPNKPIKGKVGKLKFKDSFQFTEITENTVVDNAFSVPTANGCGGIFSFLIDPIIDSKLELPSAAGKNTAIQNGSLFQATGEAVIKSEK
ncbi:MAG TPA: hypothetical protein VGN25_10530 [Solirubrobacteraceae bacterium]|jgi:hypothetical protein|nr:hypothetical protein [Solirubrobacteraceae bacterium]